MRRPLLALALLLSASRVARAQHTVAGDRAFISIQPAWAAVGLYSGDLEIALPRRRATVGANVSYSGSDFLRALTAADHRYLSGELKARWYVTGAALNGVSLGAGLGVLGERRTTRSPVDPVERITSPTVSAEVAFTTTDILVRHLGFSAGLGLKYAAGRRLSDERGGPTVPLHLAVGYAF